jgi:predicted tellurium resistance membrane protein TerC
MLDMLSSPEVWVSFATLAALEIVLGVDNIIFIAILSGRLPGDQRERARKLGLLGAFVSRLGLLATLSWIVKLDRPLFYVAGTGFSGKALILLGGGLFLLYKATKEIHHKLESADGGGATATQAAATFASVIFQIVLLDMVFSIDSIVTAVGLAEDLEVMIVAVCISMVVMYFSAGPVGDFIKKHPTTKMLALSFLLLIGVALIADGFEFHIPRGYIYFAMTFAGLVEVFNVLARRNRTRRRKRSAQ